MKSSDSAPEILYEDNHLLALMKPPGMLTQPNQTEKLSLEEWGKAYLKKKYEKSGNVYLHAIHRLDQPASGIVLFARTSKALSRMMSEMRLSRIQKTYHALVEGHLKERKGELLHTLSKSSFKSSVASSGKKAHLAYEVIKTLPQQSLIEIKLFTGRYHQIRVQFAHIGHPLIGDTKYGAQPAPRLALHHSVVSFYHPVSKENIIIRSEKSFSLI